MNSVLKGDEKILRREGEWYISKMEDGSIDIWHWCKDKGIHASQYGSSIVDEAYDEKKAKTNYFVENDWCWNCDKEGERLPRCPKDLLEVGKKLLIGNML
jgi:hypothetical protein